MNAVVGKINKKKQVSVAVINILASFNNTIVSVADMQGDVLTWSAAGANGFKNSKKSTPFAGQVAAEKAVLEAVTKYGIKTVSIKIQGPGSSRESVIRAISKIVADKNLTVTSIKDVTPVPHNGCRPPKRRRV